MSGRPERMGAVALAHLLYQDLLDHGALWTEADHLASPEDRRRIELFDGGLLMSRTPAPGTSGCRSHLCRALLSAAPEAFEVNLRVAQGSGADDVRRGVRRARGEPCGEVFDLLAPIAG